MGGKLSFVDGGAWRGDTIEAWNEKFGKSIAKIYAFEPDETAVKELEMEVKERGLEGRTTIIRKALYEKNVILRFKETDEMLEADPNGNIEVKGIKLDDVIKEVEGKLYIKMDLEGSEISALAGARETIIKYRPVMAICTYHHMEDLLLVPRYITSLVDDYKFYLRSGFHTECYAVPRELAGMMG